MLDSLFSSITANGVNIENFLICIVASIALGLIIAFGYMYKNKYSKSFVITLALLPAIVQVVIMLVNGNIGTGVAVMGAFSLVRFRSIPGSAKEIGIIFLAMAVGLAVGMGFVAIAVVFTVIITLVSILFTVTKFGESRKAIKELKITIPENLNYNGLFDDIFDEYTSSKKLVCVKTTNMGSLYQLMYNIEERDESREKDMIDAIRCRNGNLDIVCGYISNDKEVL
ncbi:MAG: DUF4956 domain-containing protein [Acutalibacteraceae bacterium]